MEEDFPMDPNQMNLSLNGCGYLGIYHVGVCSCIKKYYPQALKGKISGGSVGALVACAFMCDVPLDICAKHVMEVSLQVRSGILGPMSPDLDIMKVLHDNLDAMLPPDAHLHCDGKLNVSVTRFDTGTNVLLNSFRTRDEVLQAMLCSCFIPVYCGYEPPEFHGVPYVDAALSNNSPWLNKYTVAVAPFSGKSDICPRNDNDSEKSFSFSNTSIGLTVKNMYSLFRVLFPATPDIQKDICQLGYNDALRYLRDKGLINCNDCVAKESNSGHDNCKSPTEIMPVEISNEMDKTILEFSQHLGYRLFKYRSMKVLYYLNIPSIVTAKVAYVVISSILQKVQSKASSCVDDIWSQFLRVLKQGLYRQDNQPSIQQEPCSEPGYSSDTSCYTPDTGYQVSYILNGDAPSSCSDELNNSDLKSPSDSFTDETNMDDSISDDAFDSCLEPRRKKPRKYFKDGVPISPTSQSCQLILLYVKTKMLK